MQYRKLIYTSDGSAYSWNIGFVPNKVVVTNKTVLFASPLTGVGFSEWNESFADASAVITTYTAGVPAVSAITSNGVTPYRQGGVYESTLLTITGVSKANPGVVTVSSIGSLANGDIVTINGVLGMTQLNTNRYVVGGIAGSTFKLYDFFGNPVSTLAFGTYVSGGTANIISTPAIAPTINPINGQVVSQGQPPGLVVDEGFAGVILGTGVVGSSSDVLMIEAFYDSPAGY